MADQTVRQELLRVLADKAKKKSVPTTFRTAVLTAPPGDPENPKQSFETGDDYSNLQRANQDEMYAKQRQFWFRDPGYKNTSSASKTNKARGNIYENKR